MIVAERQGEIKGKNDYFSLNTAVADGAAGVRAAAKLFVAGHPVGNFPADAYYVYNEWDKFKPEII
jgi:hypothetical protein